MLKQAMNSIFKLMAPHFPNFPNDYVVIDLETTGTRFHKSGGTHFDGDLITELGYCYVKGGKAVDYNGFVLNWTVVPDIAIEALKNRLISTKKAVEYRDGVCTGKIYHMSLEKMQAEGGDPLKILDAFASLLKSARDDGYFFVAHNGYHFDAKMLESHFDFWRPDSKFKFKDHEIFDTGMTEKAMQSGLTPWAGETIPGWSKRVYNARLKGIKWSLDGTCVPKYNLEAKYGLDTAQAHSAGYDCLVCHHLFEEFKRIAENENG